MVGKSKNIDGPQEILDGGHLSRLLIRPCYEKQEDDIYLIKNPSESIEDDVEIDYVVNNALQVKFGRLHGENGPIASVHFAIRMEFADKKLIMVMPLDYQDSSQFKKYIQPLVERLNAL